MIKLQKLFLILNNQYYKIFLTIVIIILLFIILKKIYKLSKRKRIYVGCIYSTTGIIGESSNQNYQILLESFKYSIKKYDCNIEIIPIYTSLGDNLDNFSRWVEECATKYNIKYFFGCWRSSERKKVIPILKKYNARLFYPCKYEGYESCDNIYYLGATPNQYLIPALKFMFDTYDYYNDVYVVGVDTVRAQILLRIIYTFINDKFNKKKFNKTLCFYKLYSEGTSNFSDFFTRLFKTSPKGAIIINILEGESFFDFYKQFYTIYPTYFPNVNKNLLCNNTELIQYLDKNINNEKIQMTNRYPSIITINYAFKFYKENIKYIESVLSVNSFSNIILEDNVYQINRNDDVNDDVEFLNKYEIKNKGYQITENEYSTFLSTQFFVKTIKQIIEKGLDINDTNIYDKNNRQNVTSVAGSHNMCQDKHISYHFFISFFDSNANLQIQHQSFIHIDPDPYMGLYDKIFTKNKDKLYYSSRYHKE
jgi:hypothetical protein